MKSTYNRRKRDFCRRASFIALSVCKIRFCYETRPTDGERAKTAVLTYKLETAGVFSIAGEDSRFLYLVRSSCVLLRAHSLVKPFSQVRFREYERRGVANDA